MYASASRRFGDVQPTVLPIRLGEQLDAIGWGFPDGCCTGFFTGAVLALQSGLTLDKFGARPLVGRLVSASMIKELGPVLTGLMLRGASARGLRLSLARWS